MSIPPDEFGGVLDRGDDDNVVRVNFAGTWRVHYRQYLWAQDRFELHCLDKDLHCSRRPNASGR
jgi:hypothetical protein